MSPASDRQTDRQTDGRTDGRTDERTTTGDQKVVERCFAGRKGNTFQKKIHTFKKYDYRFTEGNIRDSTTVIAKIKGMPRSLFYVIPRYVTVDYEK